MNRFILTDCLEFIDFINYNPENPFLIYFNNGFYNLQTNRFIKVNTSKIEEKIDYNYKNVKTDDPSMLEVKQYMREVFPEREERNKVWRMLTTFLTGKIHTNQKGTIYYWIGDGPNSKTIFSQLVMKSLSTYACIIPFRNPSKDLFNSRYKRLFTISESDNNDRINIQALREYTTNDTLTIRSLYSRTSYQIRLKNHVAVITNDPSRGHPRNNRYNQPEKKIHFHSTFVNNPDPNNPYQFQTDPNISSKLDIWKEVFMYLMIKKYDKIYN